MFLKNLEILNSTETVRNIRFHKGINLIVDESKTVDKTESGNSVGKTTVLRLIDFCLDGDGKNIYVDPEFNTTNALVEDYLKTNDVLIRLTLIEDLDDDSSFTIVIERNFLAYKKKIQKINGETYGNEEFSIKLKELIFDSTVKNPKFRALIARNIRDEKNKLINTLKVLSDYTSNAQYESLFLFWLGIETEESKDKLVRDKNLETKLRTRLRKESNLAQIEQTLRIVDIEIDKLTERKKSFNVNEAYEEDLNKLNHIKTNINLTGSTISRLELRHELIVESQKDLEKDISQISTDEIEFLYQKAKVLIPDIQKTFEETLRFHNEMIIQKVKFITEELPELERELGGLKRNLNLLLIQEEQIAATLKKAGAIEELQKVIDLLNEFHERKGSLIGQKRLWISSNEKLSELEKKIENISADFASKDKLIQTRIGEFNEIFSDFSSRLDGVHSLLSGDNENEEKIYKFTIANVQGNPGTGSKKSQMSSFDLAYIKYADENNIPCLHFILLDQIENVHSNQITNLLTEIVAEVNCQYVLPVLRDKLPKEINVSTFEVLSLSQDKKLFMI